MMIEPNKCNRVLKTLVAVALYWGTAWGQDTSRPSQPKQQAALAAADTRGSETSLNNSPEFLVGNEDVLAINVWKEPEISRLVTVRSDGKISLPLVGELQASGQTPRQLGQEIAKKLQSYISDPEVTVILQEIKSQRINILGRVARPGSYLLTNTMTALDAIAIAGGFLDFAKQKSIYVLRQNAGGGQQRISFNYKDVIKGKKPEQNVKLEPHDTVVVP